MTSVHHGGSHTGARGKLINIDNGGTLTDICVIDGGRIHRTKSVTTPFDLSRCVFDGLTKVSRQIYGREDLVALLASTDHIRYSTTQGTNALVERKGPRLGLILAGGLEAVALCGDSHRNELFAALVADRCATLDIQGDEAQVDAAATRLVNSIASAGATRIVVACAGHDCSQQEQRVKRMLLRRFPSHLLGAVPILYSHEVAEDDNDVRRIWTALFNAFLHPAMERFLYRAEHRLRESRAMHPLLIFRNDGQSARVAKTVALKTYSSGPRGGMEGARALAQHYGFGRLLTMDVGGTSTDIGLIENDAVRAERYGRVEGVTSSFSLCDVVSRGVGGSSIIKASDGIICVGPQSVGSMPGPACFGLGGTEATMTDAFLVQGLLDSASFFGGEMKLDLRRARAAVRDNVAAALQWDELQAIASMEAAWVAKIADGLREYASITPDTVLAAFGGGGPLVACKVAEAVGINRIIIPGLAAVFSAFGIGFSDIGHVYERTLDEADDRSIDEVFDELTDRARRGMFAEGFGVEDCRVEKTIAVIVDGVEHLQRVEDGFPPRVQPGARVRVLLAVVREIRHPRLDGTFGGNCLPAVSSSRRRVATGAGIDELPVYRVEDQRGVCANGPAVLEEAFFTCRLEHGWRFEINTAGDILLNRDRTA